MQRMSILRCNNRIAKVKCEAESDTAADCVDQILCLQYTLHSAKEVKEHQKQK